MYRGRGMASPRAGGIIGKATTLLVPHFFNGPCQAVDTAQADPCLHTRHVQPCNCHSGMTLCCASNRGCSLVSLLAALCCSACSCATSCRSLVFLGGVCLPHWRPAGTTGVMLQQCWLQAFQQAVAINHISLQHFGGGSLTQYACTDGSCVPAIASARWSAGDPAGWVRPAWFLTHACAQPWLQFLWVHVDQCSVVCVFEQDCRRLQLTFCSVQQKYAARWCVSAVGRDQMGRIGC